MMVTIARPMDLLRAPPADPGLTAPDPKDDPFLNTGALIERYFLGITFDIIESKLALLFLLDWRTTGETTVGRAGLLVCCGVSEFGWKARGWDIPPPSHWWIVLANELVGPDEGARVEMPSLPRWRPRRGSGAPPPYRYSLGLEPNGEALVAFTSAWYLIGLQDVPDDQNPRVTFTAETEWQAICYWPR